MPEDRRRTARRAISILVLVGSTFESGVASIVVFLPIVQPIAVAAGLDPVHIGVIVCMTLALGLITPPYGLRLFIAAPTGGLSVERSFMATLPWIGPFLVVDVPPGFPFGAAGGRTLLGEPRNDAGTRVWAPADGGGPSISAIHRSDPPSPARRTNAAGGMRRGRSPSARRGEAQLTNLRG